MKLDYLYTHLPRPLQNMAISLYGYKQTKIRYKTKLPSIYENLFSRANTSTEELKTLRNERFSDLILHASKHVPFYKEYFSKVNFRAEDVTIGNLSETMPVIEKRHIVANQEQFYSGEHLRSGIPLFTSGTSGSPMKVLCTTEGRSINYAFYKKIIEDEGCNLRERKATFAGRVLFSENESKNFWRRDFYNNTLHCSSYHLSPENIPKYLSALENWNPKFIDSYPSAIYEIAKYINNNNISPKTNLKFILTSSETLSEFHRAEIETAFRTKIVDQYGCTEMAVMAHTRNKTYQINPLYSFVEFQETSEKNVYSLLCTGLVNFGMPLIRYKIGDTIEVDDDATLYNFPQSFARISGRDDDCIITPEGRRIGRMDPVFKGVYGIEKAQIIQTKLDEILVNVVPSTPGDIATIEHTLRKNIITRTSEKMHVKITSVDSIPLTKSGKFKSVISKLTAMEKDRC